MYIKILHSFQFPLFNSEILFPRYINGTRLDDRIVRTDWDAGFIEGRQYGRGKTGGQVCATIFISFVPFLIYCY